jgi:hypothetical protein
MRRNSSSSGCSILFWIWVGCGILNYGTAFAHFQGEFPKIAKDRKAADAQFAAAVALTGPVGTITLAAEGAFDHGWKLW